MCNLRAKCSHSFLFLSWTKPRLVKTGRKRICHSAWVITKNPHHCRQQDASTFQTRKHLKVATEIWIVKIKYQLEFYFYFICSRFSGGRWFRKRRLLRYFMKFSTYIMTSILQCESSNVKRNGSLLKLWLLICFIGFPEIIGQNMNLISYIQLYNIFFNTITCLLERNLYLKRNTKFCATVDR